MLLEQPKAELFFRLWFPLMEFVNERYHVRPEMEPIGSESIDPRDLRAVSNHLWAHTEIFDEYIAAADLPPSHAQIVASWKRCRPGRYILERHLKKGSVFISVEDGEVYLVKGLFSPWAELVGSAPVLLDTVLIPFLGSIITDGLPAAHPVRFGKGPRERLKEAYMTAKRTHTIHSSLPIDRAGPLSEGPTGN